MTDRIHVSLGARSYDVHVGQMLLARAGGLIAPFATSGRVYIVTDDNVARLHLNALTHALDAAGLRHRTIALPPGEQTKGFAGLETLCRRLLQAEIGRKDLVLAFGGGVIGDLAGLAAGLIKRGVDFVQIPTTLLAQVDSSVGGKTAIDTPEGKNFVGLIHQPLLVLADLDVLQTLPLRELRCGYAEIVKAGLIADADLFAWCETNAERVLAREPEALAHAVRAAIAFKARIVEADEREEGPRALLNLGHTFAHALEAHVGYGDALLHGEAVGAGLALAFAHSAQLGLCSGEDAARVRRRLESAGFTTDLRMLAGAPFDPGKLLALMREDKKAEARQITLVLARGIGQAFVHKGADAAALARFLHQQTSA
jgi:3-dehydroquinate synthase